MAFALMWFLLLYFGLCAAWMDERPVLESRDGHLIISSAKDRNITLKIMGGGYVNVNEINLLHVASAAQNATRVIDRWRMGYLAEMENSLHQLTTIVTGSTGLQRRIALLERSIDTNGTIRGNRSHIPNFGSLPGTARSSIRRINVRLKALEDALRAMQILLRENECQSNPCQNGGTCEDLYDGYQCHCPSNWEGSNCMVDVNECARFLGTDLGCQNGATCRNLPGSYRCDCLPGWFGLHCTQKTSICNTENSEALCGEHGVCVAKSSSSLGYTCICDQGWESDGTSPACTKDVDECAAAHPPCSVNPPVPCRNTRGSFACGACPHGYSGNGYYCTDIDECLTNNGGCSTSPYVQCVNTMGSRTCGACPPGYRGDGVSCIFVGGCAINNGGCHPLATCTENPSLTSSYVLCRCPPDYVGNGMGPNGCRLADVSLNSHCSSNPCVHGTCVPVFEPNGANGFTCTCNSGYSGPTCNIPVDPCSPNPCRNNGICTILNGQVACQCTTSFSGNRCETPRQTCGGVLRNPMGTLQFPMGGSTYQHGLSCAWVLITELSKVLNVTFTTFSIEQSTDCKFDFLQIHDGRNAGSQMINRFCGHTLPNDNGTIISSHNTLYLWFHSDNSISHDGFTLRWNSIDPICGGVLENNYGTITSPGSPGRYPPNRDCFWRISVAASKRIQFHFGQLMLEQNCENDYVEITGVEDERLGLFCNHTRPPPLTTPASEATVHFHSDGSNQDAGFQIYYSMIEGIPGCGGTYTSATGTISSPGHSSSYQPNMECEWKIQLPANDRIRASWLKFELEASSDCQFDFVEIYDGPNTLSRILGRYCGSDIPPVVKSNSNNLVILFKSDWSYEGEGFILSYETLCGGEFHESSGIIKSPFYPEAYHHSRTCVYEIIQPPGKGIILTIEDIDIEGSDQNCYYDYVEIFDGDNENATKLATLCGDEIVSDTRYYSTHNFMYLKFTTDSSIDGRGFKANYTTIDRRCGGLLKESTGVIQPPIGNGVYSNNEECIWTIQAPPGYVIHLSWMSFNLEYHSSCDSDYVNVYENYTSSDQDILATYCGSTKPPDLTTQERTLTILFHTDSSVTSEGFVATYIFMDVTKVCGGHYSKTNGVIRSPNYPDYYPNKKDCVWIIEAQNRFRIILTVNHFELERHISCAFDYLEIRNGGHESAPLIGKFCGTDIPTEIPSQANQMYIRFVSDFSRSMQGFEIEWDSTTQGCGSSLTAVAGDIISPNYPEPYSVNADCFWKIAVATGSLVQLVIVDLDLEEHTKCRYDFLEIFDGISHRTNRRRYCGSNYPKIIQSKSNQMTVRFRSDFSNSGRGFHLKYETQCYNKLRGYYGVIESPNFPNKYEHSMNCSWTIEAPIGNTINLTVSHFDLEGVSGPSCSYDYLQISEGDDNTPNTELGHFCGNILPKKIVSTQHQMFITFITDSFIAFNGFRLEWTVNGCGGHLIKPYDRFTSPGYPSAYPMNVDCEWLIEVDYTHSVELTFYDVNTEKRTGCFFDKIQIYEGDDTDAPKLAELCYSERPVTFTSPGNKMFVKFHSDSSYANRGFNASYKSVPIGCGGKFTTISGIIHSTNYPQNYPDIQNCEWLIEVDSNHLVNLTFLDFDLENTNNCSDDSVKIFDGATKDDLLLGIHCSNELPPSYVSSSNQMLVVMRSDSLISAKGFKAQYTRACGARIIVKDQGYITPPTGNTDVQGDTNCTWILVAENPGDHITITFTHMDIESLEIRAEPRSDYLELINSCTWLFLQVTEGESPDGPVLGTWCNNVSPPPITSTGSSLTLHLVVHYEFLGHFAAIYSVLNTGCGGNYTSEQGIITSPGYPNSYPLNAECVWILNTSPGNKIALVFSEFDIESSENCDMDYLEVREDSGIGKLISVSCGRDASELTSSSQLWIKFKSDDSGTARGFKAEYNIVGGNELEGPTGRITSPLYPLPYRRSATFSWRVTVEMNSLIRVQFTDLEIENIGEYCFSVIKIFDGYDDEAPNLLEVCGYSLPDPIESSSNVIFITMTSGIVRQGNWFDLTWLQIPRNTEGDNKEIKLSECNKEVALMGDRNNTYSFSSPGWPTGYAGNLHCNWVFTSPPGTHLVLRIMTMDLEETSDCVADSVSVYSGYALTSTTDARLESKLCLANSSMSVISGSNVMTVKFDTDSFENKTGFNAYVHRDCGGRLTEPNGVIEYDNSSSVKAIRTWHFTCEWSVTVRPGRTIKVQITEMSIQQMSDESCGDNYLLLKNGDEMLSPLLGNGKYCGTVTPAELETTGNRFYIKATGSGHYFGFKLNYREVSMNCGGDFILTNKQKKWEITSPNYPNIPPTYAECIWKATAPAGERLTIHFLDRFDLSVSENCDKEYVEIRDGGTDGSRLMGKFCRDVAPSSMSTTGNMVYVHFYTDVAEPKNGFKAVITSGEVCGGILRAASGVIESPNYPHSYPPNQNCSWIIIAPTDHNLKLQFRDIQLPGFRQCLSTDHVRIEEQLLENNTISTIGAYCGLQKPEVIETSSNKAYVYFTSDNREFVSYKGFSLNFTASQETCGGSLTALSGIIKSPGYPNPRTRARYCDWRINLPVGYQVVVNILDIDVVNEPGPTHVGYALSFYNDFRFKSKIKVLGQGASTEEIRSSSNTMIIGYWSSAGHRGFKLRYTADAPAPCGGNVRELEGNLTGPTRLPFNESSYNCHWKLELPANIRASSVEWTLTIKVTGLLGGPERTNLVRRNCIYPQSIELQDIGMLCGNITEAKYLRSPKLINELTIMNGTYGKGRVDFNLQYRWQSCGGVLGGPSHTIRSPTTNVSYPTNCVWHVDFPEGETIKLYFTKLELDRNCDKNYLLVKNGGAMAPQVAKYCFTNERLLGKYNITSISNQLWIEYFSSENTGSFELNVITATTGCGGSLQGRSREIASPRFPEQYPNNGECIWEIVGDNGYHIGLTFVDRFSLETSPNCEKDYVQVFDWIRDEGNYDERRIMNGEWKSLGKVCGRDTPKPFNTTSNRMKVIFHSNEAIQSDGFHAVWRENCGGVFQATDKVDIIQSPSYPNLYPSNIVCNYTIVAQNDDIVVEFTDFQLERGRGGDCRFDNVTIIAENMYMVEDVESYCGNSKPPLLRSLSRIVILFMTDKYVHRNGFRFKYFLNRCGGIITRPSELKPLMHGEEYFGRMNCTWVIKAPQGKSILVRFEKFILEFSTNCYFDNVAVYEGEFVEQNKRVALVCGNLTDNLPTFKSESNSMVVNFNADSSIHFEGFTAKVLFTTSSADGCGGLVNLTSIQSKSFRTQQAATYQPFEECHWTVVTSPVKSILFTINSIDIKNSINNNTRRDKCSGDYLEVRDGGGPYAKLIGQFCGNSVPAPMVSTSNKLWIRFYTDGTTEGAGAIGTLDTADSLCGLSIRVVNATNNVLTSPNYPNTHLAGTLCRWTLQFAGEYNDRMRIRFIDFDLMDSNKCEDEYLEISEQNKYINEGFGTNFIYSGMRNHPISVEMGSRLPFSSYKYCGSELPHEYYSYSNEVEVTFRSLSNNHKGFKLEYSTPNCDRNYTSEQGRIFHNGFTSCWITITVPANRTISLYFNHFSIYDAEQCTRNALQVHEGDSSGPLLAKLCSTMTPSPVFSTGNKLTLHSWTESASSYQSYDILYTTTDAGRGCGGRIFNYGGRFTSPLYPNTYRNNTVCTWDVSVPQGFKIFLQFLVFDIGTKKNCDNNNVKIYDVVPNGELLHSTYCGGDDPARLEADTNRVLVKYMSTVNNIGSGWVIAFMAQSTVHPIGIMEKW